MNRQTDPALSSLSDEQIGMEARVSRHDHRAVRLWLRLLACSTQIEQVIRSRLRIQFGTTLARFDYLAQLARHPEGLRMKSLSHYLMVTGGNVTGLTDQLVAEGLVKRIDDPVDRRALIVQMTPEGRIWFNRIAAEHEKWLEEVLGSLDPKEMEELYARLGHLRVVLAQTSTAKE
jgi:DNA-binding MarR family transcriptional regulator